MTEITRYDETSAAVTHLNPIEDIVSWISGLNSKGYTSDILSTVHRMTNKAEIKRSVQSISLFAMNSLGLIEQAYSGPAAVSFLPLYYAILNLSKIYMVLVGRRRDLEVHRYHGATYDVVKGKSRRDLLTDEIQLKGGGVLPLFYETLTGSQWTERGRKLKLCDIYPCIHDIEYEYKHAYRKPSAFQVFSIRLQGDANAGYYLMAKPFPHPSLNHPNAGNKRYLKVLNGFRKDPSGQDIFVTRKVFAPTEDEAHRLLLPGVRRFLLYGCVTDVITDNISGSRTVVSSKRLLLPEELPIWLAFFHLSNVVRYNPEFLSKVQDSKAWPMLLALRKHALLRFLLIFWSFVHQTTMILTVG